MLDDVLAPVVIAHRNGFAITFRIEGIAQGLEFFAELNVVVDLAVKGKGIPLWFILRAPAQGLVGMFQVDNGQAVKAEGGVAIMPSTGCVRSAVVHARKRPLQRVDIFVHVTGGREHAKKSAHVKIAPFN